MADGFNLNENSAYIGGCVTFKGDIIAQDTVMIEGTVEGNVTAGRFALARAARSGAASRPPMPRSKAFLPRRRRSKASSTCARPGGSRGPSDAATSRLNAAQ